jgi:hypothetical protein
MGKRDPGAVANQPSKRVCKSAPAFRLARVAATSRTSRVTTIKKNARGRRGHSTGDIVYRNHSVDRQWPEADWPEADGIVSDPPEPHPDQPLDPPKAKRKQKNTIAVSSKS